MSECARCRQPLDGEGRWNVTYGGRAHQACQQRAVWPPRGGEQVQFQYNPIIALRKMATREAFAGAEAQAHIQALMEIVGRDFAMPPPRPRRESLSEHDRRARASSSSTAPLALPTPSAAIMSPVERKRRQPPPPAPKDTPSPPTKRPSELPATTQASKHQQPTTSNTIPSPRPTRKGSQHAAIEPAVIEPKREYQLQLAVKAAGGTFVVSQNVNKDEQQFRLFVDGGERQFTDHKECEECLLEMVAWARVTPREHTKCKICGKRTKKGKAEITSICTWWCRHDVEVCFNCVPVVLRTPLMTEHSNWG